MNYEIPEPWPNPFDEMTHISYRVEETGPIHVALYDLRGRLLEVLKEGYDPNDYTYFFIIRKFAELHYFNYFRLVENTLEKTKGCNNEDQVN